MKKNFLSPCLRIWLLLAAVLAFVVAAAPSAAENCAATDYIAPTVFITEPISGQNYTAVQPAVTLSGEVLEDCGVKSVNWFITQEKQGIASGMTNNWSDWSWRAEGIPLSEGLNHIVVTAEDAAGNYSETFIDVTYNAPVQPPPPPLGEVSAVDMRQAKFTFYFDGPAYDNLDRVSIVAYLQKKSNEAFVMPFNQDVTLLVHASGIEEPIFSQTVPAGTVTGTTKYRYVKTPPGIRELTFQTHTSTSIYMYLFVENWNFLPVLKADLTPEAYQDFVRTISGYTMTLIMGSSGSDKAWQGSGPLTAGTTNAHKQELVHNR